MCRHPRLKTERFGVLSEPTGEQDDLVAILVGIQSVEHPAGGGLEPLDLVPWAMPGKDADAPPQFRRKREAETFIYREDHGEVHEQGIAWRDGEVVHHDRSRQVDRRRADDVSLRVDNAVLEVRLRPCTVPEAEQFTGSRVDLGMRSEGMRELVAKRVEPKSV